MSIDRSLYRKGMFLKGGVVGDGSFLKRSAERDPIRYGQTSSPSLKEIERRLDAAYKRLAEIAQAVAAERRR